jgi:hypothetical protein
VGQLVSEVVEEEQKEEEAEEEKEEEEKVDILSRSLGTFMGDEEIPAPEAGEPQESNCGQGPDGAAELILELDASNIPPDLWPNGIHSLPQSVWESIRASGFTWINLVNVPADLDLAALVRVVHASGLKIIINSPEGEAYSDGVVGANGTVTASARYVDDPQPRDMLARQDSHRFIHYLNEVQDGSARLSVRHGDNDFRFHHRSAATATAALLLLPGLKFLRSADLVANRRLLEVLALDPVSEGSSRSNC